MIFWSTEKSDPESGVVTDDVLIYSGEEIEQPAGSNSLIPARSELLQTDQTASRQ